MTTVSLARTDPSDADVDTLVVAVRPSSGDAIGVTLLGGLADSAKGVKSALEEAFAAVGATGKADEVTRIPGSPYVSARTILAVGLGSPTRGGGKGKKLEALRRAAGSASRNVGGASTSAYALPAADAEQIGAVAEGILLGAYTFTRFRSGEQTAPGTVEILTVDAPDKDTKAALEKARIVTSQVNLARDWVNTPPSHLYPSAFADIAVALSEEHGLKVDVMSDKQLKRDGYGGITAVGQGSMNPPRLVRIAYKARGAKKHLALVGKGVTFDSGGLSLKPPTAMETMKSDMAGAAAMLGSIAAIAALKLKVNVTCYLPLVENMPSGHATRPSDVITMLGGKTVEVLNTDAEGRLILADAIVRASQDKPDAIVDMATLTGAQMVALGNFVAGAMGNDDAFRTSVVAAADASGELLWPMPLPEQLRASIDSPIADLKNIGDRFGGMLTAALFLQEFVPEDLPWVHLDIAGPSFNESGPHDYTPKGGTGYGVRTIVELATRLGATK